MKNSVLRLSLALLAVSLTALPALAQDDRDLTSAAAGSVYVVSAKPGGVNHVEGSVTIKREDGSSGPLLKGDFVEVGELVSTGTNGRAEVLMNPGSFIRANHNSKFEFLATSLDDVEVKVSEGAVIFEVFASDDYKVKLVAGSSTFYLVKTGVYRVDVANAGSARLEVWKGQAQAGNLDADKIKKGRAAVTSGDSVAVSKFSKNMDEFEKWSKARAKLIAKQNKNLAARTLGRRVLNSYRSSLWGCYDSFGLWVYNRRFRTYSFLPFGWGWRSPYGYRLRTNTDICLYPDYFWRPYYPHRRYKKPRRGGNSGEGSGGGGGTTVIPAENVARGNRLRTPPFRRMQQTGSVRRARTRGFDTRGGGFGSSGSSRSGSRRSSGSSNKSSGSTKSTSAPRTRTAPTSTTKSKGIN